MRGGSGGGWAGGQDKREVGAMSGDASGKQGVLRFAEESTCPFCSVSLGV